MDHTGTFAHTADRYRFTANLNFNGNLFFTVSVVMIDSAASVAASLVSRSSPKRSFTPFF